VGRLVYQDSRPDPAGFADNKNILFFTCLSAVFLEGQKDYRMSPIIFIFTYNALTLMLDLGISPLRCDPSVFLDKWAGLK
jgi:hypothetical protein